MLLVRPNFAHLVTARRGINLEIRSEADCNYRTLGLGVSTVGARNLLRIESNVKKTNCLIKKVLERVFVASNKKVLEIIETYHHWQQPGGGKDEVDDATAAGGSGENSESISAQQ